MEILCEEQTVVMIKPEIIKRGLVGNVIHKFEMVGMHINQIKVAQAKRSMLEQFYKKDPRWMRRVGMSTIERFHQQGLQIDDYLGTNDPIQIGELIYHWNIRAIEDAEVIALLLSGPHAIERIKQVVGTTEPIEADRGTIRGDWCTDSVIYSTSHKRAISNLVHRSSNREEVEREKKVWFGKN